jgi:hypothetical protein
MCAEVDPETLHRSDFVAAGIEDNASQNLSRILRTQGV